MTAIEFSQGDWQSHQRLLAALPDVVDILVNNAAVGSKTVERYAGAADHWQDEALFQVNSIGPLWLVRQLLPGMIDRGYGKIANIASVGGGSARPTPVVRACSTISASLHAGECGVFRQDRPAPMAYQTDIRRRTNAVGAHFRRARVNILPGEVFGCPEPGWFRICHTTQPQIVSAGITRLGRVLHSPALPSNSRSNSKE